MRSASQGVLLKIVRVQLAYHESWTIESASIISWERRNSRGLSRSTLLKCKLIVFRLHVRVCRTLLSRSINRRLISWQQTTNQPALLV